VPDAVTFGIGLLEGYSFFIYAIEKTLLPEYASLRKDGSISSLFRRGLPRGVIIHSDRGSQYCSTAYQRLIKMAGLRCSMGRRATCYDNAAMESFFYTLKVELIHRDRYSSRQSARGAIFEYIETYYNRKRKHSAIGYKIPMLLSKKVLNRVSRITGEDHKHAYEDTFVFVAKHAL
jgi:transposase InsO family protein